jgi:thymidine phosphorylase
MELKVKLIDISTGESPVVLITEKTALAHDLHPGDRVVVAAGGKQVIATVDMTHHLEDDSQAGVFLETARALDVHDGVTVTIAHSEKPDSIRFIKKKMEGEEFTPEEMRAVVEDIVAHRLTHVELTYFVSACSILPLSFTEVVSLTKSMSETGLRLHFDKPLVIDKHCIGGVPGNRTSMITIPIMASLGYTVPKTSSRAITSPAGTADTMEVLAEVNLRPERMKQVVDTVGACLVWGGSVNLAPADDQIIRIERPLSIDVPGLMISSVMAKKLSAGSTHVLIDIPYGPGAKVETLERAEELQKRFQTIGSLLGMKMLVLITDGSQPIGYGVGPVLEAYDVLAVLKNDPTAPQDLREKSLMIAGKLLEFIGHCKKGEGWKVAEAELASGRAYAKFQEIVNAQGRKVVPPLAKYTHDVFAQEAGTVQAIDNLCVAKIARIAGAPVSKGAGLVLYAKMGHVVNSGDKLFTIYADSEEKLSAAVAFAKSGGPYKLGQALKLNPVLS